MKVIGECINQSVTDTSIENNLKQINSIPREIWVKEEIALYIKPVANKLNINIAIA